MKLGSWNPKRSSGMEGQMRQKITVSETRSIINSCIVAGGTTLRQPGSETLKTPIVPQPATNNAPKPKQSRNNMLKLKKCTNEAWETDMKLKQTTNDTLKPKRQCTSEAREMETKLQQATNETREILSSCVMEEGMTSAVEFLSVECDMIFEPDCDLETEEQQATGRAMGGEGNVPFSNHSIVSHTNGFGSHSGGDARLQNNGFGRDNFVISSHDNLGPPLVSYQNNYSQQLASSDNYRDPVPSIPNDPSLPILYRSPLIGEIFQRRGVVVYKRTSRDSPFIKIYHPNLSTTPNGLRNGKLGASSRKRVQDKSSDSGGEGPGQNPRGQRRDRSSRDPGRGRSAWVYRCGKCRKQFGSKIRLLTHRLVHATRTGDVYVCPVCESDFTNKASLKIHIQRKVCLKNVQNQFRDKRQRQQNQLRGHQAGQTIAKRGSRGTNTGDGSVAKAGNATHSCQPSPQSNTQPRLAAGPTLRENYGKVESASDQERTNGTMAYNKTRKRKRQTRENPQSKPCTTDAPTQPNRTKCKNCKTTLPQRPASRERKAGPGGALHCDKCRATSKHKRSHRERKSYECPECGSQYRKSSALKKHRRLEHDVT